MKKLLALVMAMILCLSMLTACDTPKDGEDVVYAVADAAAYLNNLYKDKAAETPVDYDVVAKVVLDQVTYTVTWSVNNDQIKIVESSKNGFYTVDVPDVTEEEIPYVLTATIKADDGTSVSKSFNRVVPVVDNSGLIGEPEENVAYKIYLKQANLEQTLYVSHEINGGKYYQGVLDPVEAPDFYVEKVDGGYKFYTMIDGVKSYVRAYLQDTPTGPSKRLDYSTTEGTVWTYKADCNAWFTTIDGGSYVFGTYNSYNTFCISDGSFMTPDKSGVSQFPAELILKEDAEALTPSEPPVNNDPEADTTLTIAEAIALGASKKHDIYTVGKYYVTGEITEIYQTTYGNMKIKDADGNILTVYGTYSADGSTRFDAMENQPKVGDTITVYGIIGQYNDTPQLKNGWITAVVPGEGGDDSGDDPEPPTIPTEYTSIADILAMTQETAPAGDLLVTGKIVSITNDMWGNMYIEDENGNQLLIYGLYDATGDVRYDAMANKPVVGDTITVVAPVSFYNGAPQLKSAKLQAEEGGDDSGDDSGDTPAGPTATSIADILAMTQETAPAGDLLVTGKIVSITNDMWGNMYIEDENGNQLLIYGLYDATGDVRYDAMANKPVVGDTITVVAPVSFYNGAPQLKSAKLQAEEGGDDSGDDSGDEGGETDGMTIAEALAAASGTDVVLTGTVVEIYQPWDSSWNNMAVYIQDKNGDKILAYRMKTLVYVGDVITVTGTITVYNEVNQIAQGCTATIDKAHDCNYAGATCDAPKTCTSCGATDGDKLGHTEANAEGKCDRCGLNLSLNATTLTVSIADYADANGWANSTKYTSLAMDENITVTVSGSSNTGKYYTTGETWRIYQNENPSIVITAAEGKTIVSVKITYLVEKTGVLTLNGNNIVSDTVVSVDGNTITFGVGNTGDVTNGQVRITAIEVIYQ